MNRIFANEQSNALGNGALSKVIKMQIKRNAEYQNFFKRLLSCRWLYVFTSRITFPNTILFELDRKDLTATIR